MNNKAIRKLAEKNLRASRKRNFFVIVTIALSAFMLTSILSLGSSYLKTFEIQQIRFMGTNVHAALTNPSERQIEVLKTDLSDYVEVGINHRLGSVMDIKNSTLLGVLWLDAVEWEKHRMPAVSDIVGNYPSEEDEIMISTWALESLGIHEPQLGMTVTLTYRLNNREDIITGAFKLSGYYREYSQIRTSNRGGIYVSELFRNKVGADLYNGGAAMLRFVETADMDSVRNRIEQALSLTEGQSLDLVPYFQNNNSSLMVLLGVIILLVVCSGSLLIYNILFISVSKDVRYYGLLKTIGTSGKQIRHIINFQIMKYCTTGIPIGVIVGGAISFGIVPMTLKLFFSEDTGMQVSFSPVIFIGAAVFTYVMTWISAMKPSRLAGTISPVAALRYTGMNSIKLKKHRSKKGSSFSMAWRNIFFHKKSACITFLSLFFGLTTFLVVTGLLGSLRAENFVEDWGDYDFVATFDISQMKHAPITEEMVHEIEQLEQVRDIRITTALSIDKLVRAVDTIYDETVFSDYISSLATNPEIMNGVDFTDPDVIKRYTDYFYGYLYGLDERYMEELNQNAENPADLFQFEAGDLVLLRSVVNQNGDNVFEPGQKIQIKIPNTNSTVSFRIASVFLESDFQSSNGGVRGSAPNMYISQSALTKITGQSEIARVEIQSDGNRDGELLQDLRAILSENSDILIMSKYEKRQEIQGFFDIMQTLGMGMSIILVMIGIMNFINTMLVSVTVRYRELAVLESIGMLKRQVRKVLMYEGLIYAVISLLLVAIIGSGILYASFIPLKNAASYAVFTYPGPEMIIIGGFVLLICIITPVITYRMAVGESITQRLRSSEGY